MFDEEDLRPAQKPNRHTGAASGSTGSDGETRLPGGGDTDRPRRRVPWRPLVIAIVVFLLLYYPVGMIWMHQINDDPDYQPPAAFEVENGSNAVGMVAALINREVNETEWVANDPFFMPSAALDNMPNFQQGMFAALGRFTIELLDQVGRTRGSSQADPDLETAAGRLKYPGDVWIYDIKTSLLPVSSSESQYRAAMRAMESYNQRIASGDAVFERRADNLQVTLDRVASDLGSASAQIDQRVHDGAGSVFDFVSDDIFYNVKGRTYGYYMILRELQVDYAKVIAERDLGPIWQHMLDSLRAAAILSPLIVRNGEPDSLVMPSHLLAQGFYLLRARTQLREVSNVLLK
ncbi:MAG: hypothetical protein CMM50_10740 [Rhodospirillaceae bacterium]|nr:hypothetical protein [Rhodospirillaceae bacterium]